MINRGVFLSVIVGFAAFAVVSQNLIINPGFEAARPCPNTYNSKPVKQVVPGWFSADTGTPDYYHRCSNGEVGVPENWASIAEPIDGDAYLGFYVFRGKYQETLQARLSEPLIKDSTYIVGAWINHASASAYQIELLNVSLMEDPVQFDLDWQPSRPIDMLRWWIKKPTELGWKKVQLAYKASGGEKILLIGALEPAIRQTAISWPWSKAYRDEPQLNSAAYYFIDAVYVKSKYQTVLNPEEIAVEPDLTLILEDINFQFNRWNLNDSTIEIMSNWSREIETTEVDHVVVSGHTDNAGTANYNLRLSQRRAEEVKRFLTSQGWPPELIEVRAFGESQPLVSNDTPESRSRNRRVVIDIYKLE